MLNLVVISLPLKNLSTRFHLDDAYDHMQLVHTLNEIKTYSNQFLDSFITVSNVVSRELQLKKQEQIKWLPPGLNCSALLNDIFLNFKVINLSNELNQRRKLADIELNNQSLSTVAS